MGLSVPSTLLTLPPPQACPALHAELCYTFNLTDLKKVASSQVYCSAVQYSGASRAKLVGVQGGGVM